jgi:hypothetical protein
MPRSLTTGFGALVLGFAAAAAPSALAQQQTLDRSVNTQNEIVKKAAATQAKINSLSAQTQKLLNQYLVAEQQIDQLKKYNKNLQAQVSDQTSRLASLNQQLSHIGNVEHGIVPLMDRMIAGLKNFINLDMPFKKQDRLHEVQKLQDLMTNSDVTISEKYRQIMATYQSELDYGRTVGAYRGPITINGKQQTVQFLRIGRISFCYQTLDASHNACWNKAKHQWVSHGYRRSVSTGLAIAKKQSSPTLTILPVLAPQAPLKNTKLPPVQAAAPAQTAPISMTEARAKAAAAASAAAPQTKSKSKRKQKPQSKSKP